MERRGKQSAQTAIELAVFGAILIFALGTIIRASVSRGNQQNALLRASRIAMSKSYDTSASMSVASRNTATVLVVEDRLTAGSDKYGPFDRIPYIMSASATHSANIFMPVDFGHVEDLPIFDLFVNGKLIPLSTAAFKTVNILSDDEIFASTGIPAGSCGGQCTVRSWVTRDIAKESCMPCPDIAPNCVGQTTFERCANMDPCGGTDNTCTDCSESSIEIFKAESVTLAGCAKLYTIIDNNPRIEGWCDSIPCPIECATNPIPGCDLTAPERFDLDFDGTSDVPADQWPRFSWQWSLVMGFKESEPVPPASNLAESATTPIAINELLMGNGIDMDSGKNLDIDIDGDLKLERVLNVYSDHFGRITKLDVRDNQDGDIDFTFNGRNEGIEPGLTRDLNIYTRVRGGGDGTYLRIEEGKLFSAGNNQFIRTASKKDSIDLVERVFKISNDTGRLCLQGVPQIGTGPQPIPTDQITPPIEACGNCFSAVNIERTCMDPESLLIFIRSRITDYHGHKWVTDRGNDPFIEYLGNGL